MPGVRGAGLARLLRRSGAAIAALALIAAALLLLDEGVRAALKARLLDLDARVLGGRGRMAWHIGAWGSAPDSVAPAPAGAYAWLGPEPFLAIAHALGPVLHGGPNSLEALEAGRRLGFRVFEVDLALTTDGRLVCYHGADATLEVQSLTYARYADSLRARGIAPCEFRDVVAEARAHSADRFVLDVKNRFEESYALIRAEIGDARVGRSFIPQIYDFGELVSFRRDPLFAGEIFTSYRSPLPTQAIFATARRLGIQVVTLTLERFDALRGQVPADLVVLTHPVDDPMRAAQVRESGARGIYTNYIAPNVAPELFMPWSDRCRPPVRFACDARPGAPEQ